MERGGRTVPLNVSAGLGHSIYAPVRFACRPRRVCSRCCRADLSSTVDEGIDPSTDRSLLRMHRPVDPGRSNSSIEGIPSCTIHLRRRVVSPGRARPPHDPHRHLRRRTPRSGDRTGHGLRHVGPAFPHGWHGSMRVGDVHTYCIHPGLPVPTDATTDHGTSSDVNGLSPQQLVSINHLVTSYGQTRRSVCRPRASPGRSKRSSTATPRCTPGDTRGPILPARSTSSCDAPAPRTAAPSRRDDAIPPEAEAVPVPRIGGALSLTTDEAIPPADPCASTSTRPRRAECTSRTPSSPTRAAVSARTSAAARSIRSSPPPRPPTTAVPIPFARRAPSRFLRRPSTSTPPPGSRSPRARPNPRGSTCRRRMPCPGPCSSPRASRRWRGSPTGVRRRRHGVIRRRHLASTQRRVVRADHGDGRRLPHGGVARRSRRDPR